MTQTRTWGHKPSPRKARGREAAAQGLPGRPRAGSLMLTGRGAVSALFAACFLGLLLTAWTGWSALADVNFVIACGLVTWWTRARGLRYVVVCPPLAFFAGTVIVALLTVPGTFLAVEMILVTLGGSAPWLCTGTALAAAIAFGHGWRPGRLRRRRGSRSLVSSGRHDGQN